MKTRTDDVAGITFAVIAFFNDLWIEHYSAIVRHSAVATTYLVEQLAACD
jgi:hypothetical protein